MNTTVSIRDLFRSLCIALVLMLALATLARAQEKPATPAEPPAVAEKPAPPPAPAAGEKSELRRLDAAPAPKADEAAVTAGDQDKDTDEPKSDVPPAKKKRILVRHRSNGDERVSIGHDSHLAKGETADAVVSILGSSTAEGDVSDAVVSVFGDTRVTGSVGDAAVAVLGSTYVNSHVQGEVVAVGGDVELGPDAVVDGDVVSVGGTVRRDANAITHGQVNSVSVGRGFSHMEGLRAWLHECAFQGRMLGLGRDVRWAWGLAIGFLVFYILLALLFRDGVEKCVATFESRPGYSILTAFLSVLMVPIVVILLAITGVGLIIVPFIVAGIVFATLFGKAVLLTWLGRRFTNVIGGPAHPALAILLGGILVLILYLVPVLGIVVFKLLGWVGMGVVIYTLIQGMKREKPVAPLAAPGGVVPAVPLAVAPLGAEPAPAVQAAPVLPAGEPALSSALLARAGFWHRLAALLLDVILVGIIVGPVSGHGGLILPALATYAAVMWKLKGSTIGGIICNLHVVRLDGREIDWATAIVRSLGCFLSAAIVCLGFIWVAFDPEKQSWHDKIAGTVVVKSSRGRALV